jgi:serine/threonine protein kinase
MNDTITRVMKLVSDTMQSQLSILSEHETKNGVVYKISNDSGSNFALKFASKQDNSARYLSIKRESINTKAILKEAFDDFFIYSNFDENSDIVWMVTKWAEGETILKTTQKLLKNDCHYEDEIAPIFIKACNCIQKMHNIGWVHGDIQTTHLIYNKQEFRLIDFEWSRKISDIDSPYKGAMIHFSSPHIIKQMLDKSPQVTNSFEDDLFSLSATLYTAYTGKTIYYYGDDPKKMTLSAKMQAILKNNHSDYIKSELSDNPKFYSAIMSATFSQNNRATTPQDLADKL